MAQQFYSPLQLNSTLTVGVDDTGYDVIFYGATSGRYLQWDESADSLRLNDGVQLFLGSSTDFVLTHNGSNSYISNYTGDLYIEQAKDDGDIIFKCDDGSGGTTAYLTLDGGVTRTAVHKEMRVDDAVLFSLGASADLKLFHNGTDSYIENDTGDLYIKQGLDDGDIKFLTDDGSGGTTEYFRIDGGEGRIVYNVNSRYLDSAMAMFGTGADLKLYHDGSSSYIENNTGSLNIMSRADDADLVFWGDDGSGGDGEYFRLDGGDEKIVVSKPLNLLDSTGLKLGTGGNDFSAYHNGTDTYLDNNTGNLNIRNTDDDKDIIFSGDDGSGGVTAYLTLDGSTTDVELHKQTNIRQPADSEGLKIYGFDDHAASYGNIYLDGSGHLRIQQSNSVGSGYILIQAENYVNLQGGSFVYFTSHSRVYDNNMFAIGTGADFQMTHNGTDTTLEETTGDLYIKNSANDKDIIFQSDNGSGGTATYFFLDGSATQTTFQYNTRHNDSVEARFGDSSDLKIYHDASDSYIEHNGTGDLKIYTGTDDGDIIFRGDDGSGGVTTYFSLDGGENKTIFYEPIRVNDNVRLNFGNQDDLVLRHNGTDGFITNGTGDLKITNDANDKDIIFSCDDGSGGATAYLTLDGSSAKVLVNRPSIFYDTIEMASYIYHNGDTNTYFGFSGADTYTLVTGGTTALTVNSSQAATFAGDVQAAGLYVGSTNTSFDFYNNGTSYLNGASTLNGAVTMNSTLTVGVDDTGHDVKFFGATSGAYMLWDESVDDLLLMGGSKLGIGLTPVEVLDLKASSGDTRIRLDAASGSDTEIKFFNDGSAQYTIGHDDATDNFVIGGANVDAPLVSVDKSGNATFAGGDMTIVKQNGSPTINMLRDANDPGTGTLLHYLNFQVDYGGSHQDWGGIEHRTTTSATRTKLNLNVKSTSGNVLNALSLDGTTDGTTAAFAGSISVGGGALKTYHSNVTSVIALDDNSSIFTRADETYIGQNFYYNSSDAGTAIEAGYSTLLRLTEGEFYIYGTAASVSADATTSLQERFKIDTSGNATFTGQVNIPDSTELRFGDGDDFAFQHNGTHNLIKSHTGDLKIINYQDDGDIMFFSDDMSGGITEYFRLDGELGYSIANKHILFEDSVKARFGSSADLEILHDGSNSYIHHNNTGDLEIKADVGDIKIVNYTNDKDIIFKSDDGSGGTTEYFRLDGSAVRSVFLKNALWADNVKARFGSGGDLEMLHNGTNSFVQNNTGDLFIQNLQDDGDIEFKSDDGSGGIATYLTLDGGEGYTSFAKNLRILDSVYAQFGTSGDFSIGHDGTNTTVQNYTGDLTFTQNSNDKDIIFQSDDQSGGVETYFFLDGSVGVVNFPDDKRLTFGTDRDLFLYHTGSGGAFVNFTGDLVIENRTDDGDIIFKSDDGSGGTTTYLTLDGGFSVPYVALEDSAILALGTSKDLLLTHDGTDSKIDNMNTGHLKIRNFADDKDIIFQCDDGSGGVATYFKLSGVTSKTIFSKTLNLQDSVSLYLGTGNDLQLVHNSANSEIVNATGNLTIKNTADDSDIIFQSDDGSGGTTAYITLDGSQGFTTAQKAIRFEDGVQAQFGSGNDSLVTHSGSNMSIVNSTGHIYFANNTNDGDIYLQCDDGSGGTTTYLTLDGSQGFTTAQKAIRFDDSVPLQLGTGNDMYLSHNGTNSFITNSNGDLTISNIADDKDVILMSDDGSGGTTAYITLDGSQGFTTVQKDMQFADDIGAKFGAGNDLRIDHNGSSSAITNNTGDLTIKNNTDDGDIVFKSDDGSGGTQTYLTIDGGADRTIFSRSSRHKDNIVAAFGTSEDLQIYHDGSNSYIVDGGTGSLKIQTSQITINNAAGNEAMINATQDGAVNLYYNGQGPKISTGTYGPTFNYSVTGNTDGNSAGDIVKLGETTTVAGKIYHYKSDGAWELVDADAASTCDGLLAVALGTSSSTNGMLLRGMVTLDHDPGAVGDTLFVSTTAGQATATAPSGSGDIVRVIGYCLNASNGQIWFNPDGAFVEVTAG